MNAIESQQICSSCERAIRHGVGKLGHVPGLIRRIISEELWRERKVETGEVVTLSSFRELITAPPYKGWGEDPTKVEAILRDDVEALAMWREAMKEQGKRNDLRSNPTEVKEDRGRAYTASRLMKQRPDLFEKVKAGELSANKAAIEAGFRKVKTPYDQLQSWWKKASDVQKSLFRDYIETNP